MRLIDADALIDKTDDRYSLHEIGRRERDDIVDALEYAPTIQPEIVRCEECKYAEYIDDVQTLWCTECGQGRTVAPNDFCSYAERREVTT